MLTIFKERPVHFSPFMEVAGCYLEHEGKILFLLRAKDRLEGDCWGVPGGKLEKGEEPLDAAVRELHEEIGVEFKREAILYLLPLYVKKPFGEFVFHLLQVRLTEVPLIRLNDEHTAACWLEEKDLDILPMVLGGKEAYLIYLQNKR
ncbi:MAG: NUDIX domain-containing protein [Verrucomicrobiota bacterium]|nr:NUDIX domain-containing protein [Verrucomicrobiota bacterium]